MEEIIITYLIQKGGVWGLLLSLAIFWILFRERMWYTAKGNKKEETITEVNKVELILDETKEIKENQKISSEKLEKLTSIIEACEKTIDAQEEKIAKLTEQLQQVNDERIEELKSLLQNYSKTMTELTLALEKIKFVLKTKLDGN